MAIAWLKRKAGATEVDMVCCASTDVRCNSCDCKNWVAKMIGTSLRSRLVSWKHLANGLWGVQVKVLQSWVKSVSFEDKVEISVQDGRVCDPIPRMPFCRGTVQTLMTSD